MTAHGRGARPAGPALQRTFFLRPAPVVARDLLGRLLVREGPEGDRISGRIVETEAYGGPGDLASHARSGPAGRAAILWGLPGLAYVYRIYGLHWMLNVVVEPAGCPAAVLIRAVEPQEGIRIPAVGGSARGAAATDGPAKVCRAFALDGGWNGYDLCAPRAVLRIETGAAVPGSRVGTAPRVGISRVAEPWRSLPWNFRVRP